jgi:all-trans-retinol 13,14-reductase
MEDKYDIVIIGSGLGGLLCGAILSKNGFKICILEKNLKIGGCLGSYSKDGALFDTGVHYIGGLDKGQNLYQIFSYVGLMSKLKVERLSMDHFDVLMFGDDPKQYGFAQTYDRFIESLAKDFPNERKGIIKYCDRIKQVCECFPLYNLRNGEFISKFDILNTNARDTINECVSDPLLQNILAGSNSLYAGVAEKTPFYIHALILNSYIESSWKCKNGGSEIAKGLSEIIENNGGKIFINAKVVKILTKNGIATHALTSDDRLFSGNNYISDLHPASTISIIETDIFRKAYTNRINNLENTRGAFTLNVVFKEDIFPCMNYNLYYFSKNDVWAGVNYNPEEWPDSYAYFSTSINQKTTSNATILSYMKFSELSPWVGTYNTIYQPNLRGNGYEEFKQEKAEKLIDLVEKGFQGFRQSIKSYHTSTPLTYRDYLGTPEGSLYGILRDYREPFKTFIPTRTKLPNLLLTGQNLNVHGVLGVSVSAIITCGELIGIESLLDKIRKA